MPTLDLSDEELQGLILICAQASGPGVTWMLTNALLTKAQAASQKPAGPDWRPSAPNPNGLDHEPLQPDPPAPPSRVPSRRS